LNDRCKQASLCQASLPGSPGLPAIAAVAAISTPIAAAPAATATASATAATVAAASTAVSSTSAATAPATATPASSALGLRPRLIYHQVPAAEILTVQGVDRPVRIFVVIHFNEGETARLSRKAIAD
jgi:hypothetical protein